MNPALLNDNPFDNRILLIRLASVYGRLYVFPNYTFPVHTGQAPAANIAMLYHYVVAGVNPDSVRFWVFQFQAADNDVGSPNLNTVVDLVFPINGCCHAGSVRIEDVTVGRAGLLDYKGFI